jgi:hypothetical protein
MFSRTEEIRAPCWCDLSIVGRKIHPYDVQDAEMPHLRSESRTLAHRLDTLISNYTHTAIAVHNREQAVALRQLLAA